MYSKNIKRMITKQLKKILSLVKDDKKIKKRTDAEDYE